MQRSKRAVTTREVVSQSHLQVLIERRFSFFALLILYSKKASGKDDVFTFHFVSTPILAHIGLASNYGKKDDSLGTEPIHVMSKWRRRGEVPTHCSSFRCPLISFPLSTNPHVSECNMSLCCNTFIHFVKGPNPQKEFKDYDCFC